MRSTPRLRILSIAASLAVAGIASFILLRAFATPDTPETTAPDRSRGPAPLFSHLGSFTKPVSTRNPLAQRYFDQGMMFLYGFNHSEAIRSFEAAATVDPKLAIAWWGAAFAYGPNINAPMEDDALPPALVALGRARELAPHAAAWERDYIEALGTRYSENHDADQAVLNTDYARAMGEVARRYPRDLDAAVLYADAVMNTMAWDYWQPDRVTPKRRTREVIALLEDVLRKRPDHPGANHAMIHLAEAGPEPRRALASADRLKFYAPDAGHLVHMPSHIYMRVGLYHEAALANERAALSDRRYIAQCQAQGYYPGAYYPHNEHFLWWAFTFEGRRKEAFAKADEIVRLANSPMCGTSVVEKARFTHLRLLTAVRFGDWEAILAATEPPAGEALDRVIWHWARATAFAAQGETAAARREAAATRELAGSDAVAAMDSPYLPAVAIAGIARHIAESRAALARRANDDAIAALRAAVALEDTMPYMEPAFWFYPTRHTLGAILLTNGDPAAAADVFREDLRSWPENGWSLHGLALSLQRQGDAREAAAVRARFENAWQYADIQPSLAMY